MTKPPSRFPIAVGLALAALILNGCGGAGTSDSSAPFANNSNDSAAAATKQAALSYGVTGTRGSIPIDIQQGAGGVAVYRALDSSGSLAIDTSSDETVDVTVPTAYADRAFVKWTVAGQDVATSPAVSFVPSTLPKTGALTAVYQPVAATSSAFSPNFTRAGFPSWDHFPVKVYLDSTVAVGSANATSIVNGMNRWVQASGGLISYTLVTDATQADITIGFGSIPSGLAALTDADWDGNLHLTKAAIHLNPAGFTGQLAAVQNLDTVIAHEFGHSLGLIAENDLTAGHSTDPNDTMYVTGNAQIGLISARDINTVATDYLTMFNGTRSVATRSAKPVGPMHHATIQ